MNETERLRLALKVIQEQANAQAYWGIAQMAGRALAGETIEYSERQVRASASSVRAMVKGNW